MANLSDLETKRGELNAAIVAYKQAIQDLAEGVVTQQDVDAARTTAQTVGDEYAKLIAQVKLDDPNVTDDDQLFSNPAQQGLTRRDDVGKIMRTGKLDIVEYLDFNDETVDSSIFTLVKTSTTDIRSSYLNGGTGKFLRLSVDSGSGSGRRIYLETVKQYPVGSSFQFRIKQSSINQISAFMLRNGRYDGTPYVVGLSGAFGSPPLRIGGYLDENGVNGDPSYQANEQFTGGFVTFEIRRVDENTLEWYREGELLTTTNIPFANNYRFVLELFRSSGSSSSEHLDIDWVRIVSPAM